MRSIAWLVMVCLLGCMAAPALEASARAEGEVALAATTSDDEADEAEDDAEDADDESDDEGDDSLFSQTPRNDTEQRNQTLTALMGGLALGVLGLTFGPFGFVVGGILGAGLGYLLGRELFPDRYSDDYGYGTGYGSTPSWNPANADGFSTPPDTPLRTLEENYFAALEEYRRALRRSDDREALLEARQNYQDAYQALVQGKVAASR